MLSVSLCVCVLGDPAGPASAAQHSGAVPAADVRRPAAAPHAADCCPPAAAPEQRAAPEPCSCAAGTDSDLPHCSTLFKGIATPTITRTVTAMGAVLHIALRVRGYPS